MKNATCCIISSPGQRPCELLPSLGIRPSVVRRNLSHLNLLLWSRDGPWVDPFQNYVRQPRPPFKMAAVTKNRNFFNCPLLLYYKSKWAQIVTAATLQWVVLHLIRVFLWNFSFSRFIQIMQIRHILIKDHI